MSLTDLTFGLDWVVAAIAVGAFLAGVFALLIAGIKAVGREDGLATAIKAVLAIVFGLAMVAAAVAIVTEL